MEGAFDLKDEIDARPKLVGRRQPIAVEPEGVEEPEPVTQTWEQKLGRDLSDALLQVGDAATLPDECPGNFSPTHNR